MKEKTKKMTRNKGPGKEVALENLKKAHEASKEKKTLLADLSSDMSAHIPANMSEDMSRDFHKETCGNIAYMLGRHVEQTLKQTSKKVLLEKAYGFKSLSDTYHSYLKLQYPLGLDSRDSSQLHHLLGSILPQLKQTLHVHMPPPQPSRQVIDLPAASVEETSEMAQAMHNNARHVPAPVVSGDK